MLFLITPLIKTKNPGNYILNNHKHILKGGEKKGTQEWHDIEFPDFFLSQTYS